MSYLLSLIPPRFHRFIHETDRPQFFSDFARVGGRSRLTGAHFSRWPGNIYRTRGRNDPREDFFFLLEEARVYIYIFVVNQIPPISEVAESKKKSEKCCSLLFEGLSKCSTIPCFSAMITARRSVAAADTFQRRRRFSESSKGASSIAIKRRAKQPIAGASTPAVCVLEEEEEEEGKKRSRGITRIYTPRYPTIRERRPRRAMSHKADIPRSCVSRRESRYSLGRRCLTGPGI